MNDATLDGVEGGPRGWGMKVGAVAARLGGGVESPGDETARTGTGMYEGSFGGLRKAAQ